MFASDLAQEVLQVLPPDPAAQIELANKIVNYAYAQRVAQVESECQQLREAVISKQSTIKGLERRVGHLEAEVVELQAKNKAAIEDNHKLQSEKSALIETVKKLNREIAKLEAFKKSLIQHLQEEEDEPSQMARSLAAVDLNSERLVADVLNSASKQSTSTSLGAGGLGAAMGVGGLGYSSVKTAPTPGISSSTSRPATYSSGSPRHSYQSQSPTAGAYPSSQLPNHSSQQSSYSGSVGQGGTGGGGGSPGGSQPMDGKEFFRQARARLSYEQFSLFLNAIKDLNSGRYTRDETLRFVRDLCGPAHADLYVSFEQLLSRHMTGF